MINSYPSIFTVGHKAVKDLFLHDVQIEEKVDGSQFSFANLDGKLWVRSKSINMDPWDPPNMFKLACETVRQLYEQDRLPAGYIFRGEAVCKPKHNALTYNRIPKGGVVVFDVQNGLGTENYLSYDNKKIIVEQLGLEVVPLLYWGRVSSADQLYQFIGRESFLGGAPIEGIVVKPLNRDVFGVDKKLLIAKFVSEQFKEVHREAWKKGGEFKGHTPKDIIEILGDHYRTEARWLKAIQHLNEAGRLELRPQDIPLVLKEVQEDILREEEDDLKAKLLAWALKNRLSQKWTKGLPEFYKQWLLSQQQFDQDDPGYGHGV